MPTMQDSLSVPANALSINVLAGQLYEFVNAGANITFACTGSAAGLRATFTAGIPWIQDQAINSQNRFPLIPDDIMLNTRVPGGRLLLQFRNTTAAALNAFWRVDVN